MCHTELLINLNESTEKLLQAEKRPWKAILHQLRAASHNKPSHLVWKQHRGEMGTLRGARAWAQRLTVLETFPPVRVSVQNQHLIRQPRAPLKMQPSPSLTCLQILFSSFSSLLCTEGNPAQEPLNSAPSAKPWPCRVRRCRRGGGPCCLTVSGHGQKWRSLLAQAPQLRPQKKASKWHLNRHFCFYHILQFILQSSEVGVLGLEGLCIITDSGPASRPCIPIVPHRQNLLPTSKLFQKDHGTNVTVQLICAAEICACFQHVAVLGTLIFILGFSFPSFV